MRISRLSISLVGLVVVVVTVLLLDSIGHARKSPAQDREKSLEIQRHANEPLELLDFKVSEQSHKDRIKVKHRNGDGGREGLDRVEFKDTDDWFKRVRVRLRNVSGKPIIGMEAYLYFRLPDTELRFRVRLSAQTEPRQTQPLDPGADNEPSVTDQSWARTANILAQYGKDPNLAAVTLSVETVGFGDGSQWDMGRILRRDPGDPQRWIPIETKKPPGISRLTYPAEFRPIAFSSEEIRREASWGKSDALTLTRRPLQANALCVTNGGYIADRCSTVGCYTITRLGGGPGTQSSVPVADVCQQLPDGVDRGYTCTDQTIHYALQDDPSCSPPEPTPTPEFTPTPEPSPTPTPDCASFPPPTTSCPAGQTRIPGTWPFCYPCVSNPFATPSPSPRPS